jgi:Putative Fe-S cluster
MNLPPDAKSQLVASFWKDAPSYCPKHEIPMRSFFVERVYKPQVVMVCPKGEMFRFDQKPKQIEFSRPHLKTMVLDAQEREGPACPQDFSPLIVYRTPAKFLPVGWDFSFVCPTCLSYGQWVDSGRPEEDTAAAPKVKKEAPPFHDETIPLPKRMEMAKEGNLSLKLYAAMAQTDCTACGYDCEGYAAALAAGKENDPNLCVPGKDETLKVVKDLLKGTGLPAAAG